MRAVWVQAAVALVMVVEAVAVLVVILLDEADYMLCGIWC